MAARSGVTLKIDSSGRIVVPKPLRERLGLKPGTELEVDDEPGGLRLRAVRERPALIRVDGLWVHQGVAQPNVNLDRAVEETRDQRIESLLRK